MADRVRKVGYVYLTVPNRAGQGARILGALKQAKVSLVAYSGFPTDGGTAQIDSWPKSRRPCGASRPRPASRRARSRRAS